VGVGGTDGSHGHTGLPRRSSARAFLNELLRNRLILGGLGLLVVLLLTTIVLVALGDGDSDASHRLSASEDTPDAPTVVLREGIPGRALRTTAMRAGPGSQYAILGTIPRQAVVAVIGRNEDSDWLQVNYPATSRLRGWVPATVIDVTGSVAGLAIAQPEPETFIDTPTPGFVYETPIVVLPTEPPEITLEPTQPADDTPTPAEATPTRRLTETPGPTEPAPSPTRSQGGGQGNKRP
jgi:uncharacterized protein YraI